MYHFGEAVNGVPCVSIDDLGNITAETPDFELPCVVNLYPSLLADLLEKCFRCKDKKTIFRIWLVCAEDYDLRAKQTVYRWAVDSVQQLQVCK